MGIFGRPVARVKRVRGFLRESSSSGSGRILEKMEHSGAAAALIDQGVRSAPAGAENVATRRQGTFHDSLRTLFHAGSFTGLTDGQLLERFALRDGEAAERAFAALVERHGGIVLSTCRSILRDDHEARDAFQATFLVLVRKAGSLWVRDSLGPWLHRVAYRAASRARRDAERRRRAEREAAGRTANRTVEAGDRDLATILHEEVDRLPERYRIPVVLCDLEGRTYEETARHLGCPVGTIKSRLARGRECLRGRLIRRGLSLATGMVVAEWSASSASASVSPALIRATIRAAARFATVGNATAGAVSASVVTLAEGVLRTMLRAKVNAVVSTFVAVAIAVTTMGWFVRAGQGVGESPRESTPQATGKAAARGIVDLQGNWIVRGYPSGQALGLVKIDLRDRQPRASLLSVGSANFFSKEESAVEDPRIDEESVHFTLRLKPKAEPSARTFVVDAHVMPGDDGSKVLFGSMEVSRLRFPAELERTDQTVLDPKKADALGPGTDDLTRYNRSHDAGEKRLILEGILKKYPSQPITYTAALMLTYELARSKASPEEVRDAATQAMRMAARYGREMERSAAHFVAWGLVNLEGRADLALDVARKAEAVLRPTDPVSVQASILKTLAAALRRAGKKDESRALGDRIARLDEILDRESIKKMPEVKLAASSGRPARHDRAVLVEVFAEARLSYYVNVASACDALMKTYSRGELVLIAYHTGETKNQSDALASEESAARARYYGLAASPSICVDGKARNLMQLAMLNPQLVRTPQAGYDLTRSWVEDRSKVEPQAELGLEVGRQGEKIHIKARVSKLKRTGDPIRLRFVLLETSVHYDGGNDIRLSLHVVRAFPGGVDGLALNAESTEHEASVHTGVILKNLDRYLDRFADERAFPDNDRPIEFGPLKVVAFVQDDASKEILQATQIDVPPLIEAPSGRISPPSTP
jgi:RNA polymerase sigma factor (sigma-70 family)